MSDTSRLLAGSVLTLTAVGTLPLVTRLARDTFEQSETGPAATPASAPAPVDLPPVDPFNWAPIIWTIIAILLVLVLAAALTAGATLTLARRRRRRDESRARAKRWNTAAERLNTTAEAVTAFETDPESVYFTRPLLADVTEPLTAAFYTAFTHAQSFTCDTIPGDSDAITEFTAAVDAAHRTFLTADENARRKARIGIIHNDHKLSRDERAKLAQARKLMALAQDSTLAPEHARNALTKALEILDDVGICVPDRITTKITASIESGANRQALTAATQAH